MPNPHRKAKLFMNNRSQAVRFRKEGEELILSPRPSEWSSYLAEAPVASATFMEDIEDLPVQERKP